MTTRVKTHAEPIYTIIAYYEGITAPRVIHSGDYESVSGQFEDYRMMGSELDWGNVTRLTLNHHLNHHTRTVHGSSNRFVIDSLHR